MPATRAGRALAQDAADYSVYGVAKIIGVLMDILLSYYVPAAFHLSPTVSFLVFLQTRLVYPQLF